MNYKKLLIVVDLIFVGSLVLFGQTKAVNRDKYLVHIGYAEEHMEIDGLLDEGIWQIAEKAAKFQRVTPTDTGFAIAQTEVMVCYDETNLYVGAVCYDPTPGKRFISSLRRDFNFNENDNFALILDTYNDQTNGFCFYISAAGVQYDKIGYNGNMSNTSWDTKWKSDVRSYDDYWVVEMAIPFRSLRYFEGDMVWGINFGRFDLKTNEKSAWAPMPRQFNHSDLAYTGTLIWDKPLKKQGLGLSLIPYASGRVTKDNINNEEARWNGDAGFDAKVMLSTSMNLDMTVNPDYSQVEEDRQVTNLDRFEISFPERRQFFLENSDLFAALGSSSARPFFSRRIGLNVPVYAGMRLSGSLGDKWRLGLLDIQTGGQGEIPAGNFAVAALQRQVFSRSNITAFFINKEITGDYNDTIFTGNDYNRVAGLEYNLASSDNRWSGKAFYHQSFYPGASGDAATAAGDMTFSTRYFNASMSSAWVGADYNAELGYIRRTGYFQMAPSVRYTFYPSAKAVLSHGPSLNFNIVTDPDFTMTDRKTGLLYNIGFQDRSLVSFDVTEEFVLLDRPFDPTNTGGLKLEVGESFNWVSGSVGFKSDTRRVFNYSLNAGYGDYYNGTRWNVSGSVSYRIKYYGSFEISANYNNISLPEPYSSAKLLLISPRLDITFTDKLFLTTFVQYNDQIDNLNVNIRFQWRFAPVSDLFIVYTGNSYVDNPAADGYSNKDRGLAVKLSYWFN